MDIVKKIANEIKDKLGDLVTAITVYGSYAQGTHNKHSDIDYYIVLREIKVKRLKDLARLKVDLQNKYAINLSINIIKEKEIPKYRKGAFFHKNRYALFLHEANKIDKVLYGENPFYTDNLPSHDEIRLEAIRMINTWAYTIRKILVNKGSVDSALKDALRFCIYSTQYANAFNGDYPLTTQDSIKRFKENFKDFIYSKNIGTIYKWKIGEKQITNKDLVYLTCLDFLEGLDEFLYTKYEINS